MAGPDRDRPQNLIDAVKTVFDVQPEGEGGIGPTLGQDLGRPGAPDRDAANAQQDARKPQAGTPAATPAARGDRGDAGAPDQTRAGGTLGGINQSEGM